MKKNSLFKRVLSSILALVLIITGTISNTSIKTSARTTSLYTDAEDLYDNSAEVTGNEETNLDAWTAQLVGDNKTYSGYSSWVENANALRTTNAYAYRFHTGDCETSVQSGKEHTGDLPNTYDTNETQEKGDYIWFSTAKNDEGDIVVQYEGLWIYQLDDNNKPVKTKVDATCTVTKMVRDNSGTDMDGYVGVGNDIFDVKFIHLDEVKVQYKFYKAGSNFTDEIKIKFNTTMTDLDNEQYVGSGGYPTPRSQPKKARRFYFCGTLHIAVADPDFLIHHWFVWDNLSERGE